MNQALTIISVCVILGMCLMGALGCWYFVNSQAAEDGFFRIVDALTEGINRICLGVLIVLSGIAVSIVLSGIERVIEGSAGQVATAYRIIAETERQQALPILETPYLLEKDRSKIIKRG